MNCYQYLDSRPSGGLDSKAFRGWKDSLLGGPANTPLGDRRDREELIKVIPGE